MKRARREMLSGVGVTVAGLTVPQIMYLIGDWKQRNGDKPVPGGDGSVNYVEALR